MGPTYSLAGIYQLAVSDVQEEVFMESSCSWSCHAHLFFQLPVYSCLVTMGLERVGRQSLHLQIYS